MRQLGSCATAVLLYALIAGCGNSSTPANPSMDGGVKDDGGVTGGGGAAGAGGAADGGPDAGIVWGTFDRPFAADSLWNSRPLNPVLGTYQIPPTQNPSWYPVVAGGAYSTAAFRASDTDPPMTVQGKGSAANPSCPDVGGTCAVVIPHWPATVMAATGTDGHADIIAE